MSETIFTAKKLLTAYYDCRKNKRKTINALKYEINLENNLVNLLDILKNRQYYPGKSICFVVTKPKVREIFAADFGDRIIHHLLINEVQNIWEKKVFIEDSYACRPKKGNHFGVARIWKKSQECDYYGIFDIANFFGSMDKSIIWKCFYNVIDKIERPTWWKDEILWLAKTIIFHNPAKNYYYKGDPSLINKVPPNKSLIGKDGVKGLPIGNLTSQFLANVYLNELDQYVTQILKVKGYGRYVDDFIVLGDSKQEIRKWRWQIKQFLDKKLHLTLHPKKFQIQPTRHGIPFVGYFIKPNGITVRRNVVKTLKDKIYWWNKEEDVENMIPSINSYYGHLGKCRSLRLRKHLTDEHLSRDIKTKIEVVGSWKYFKLKKVKNSKK